MNFPPKYSNGSEKCIYGHKWQFLILRSGTFLNLGWNFENFKWWVWFLHSIFFSVYKWALITINNNSYQQKIGETKKISKRKLLEIWVSYELIFWINSPFSSNRSFAMADISKYPKCDPTCLTKNDEFEFLVQFLVIKLKWNRSSY